ncbi:hypothetical protein K3495_g15915, partial [Podosphaera aphanis]
PVQEREIVDQIAEISDPSQFIKGVQSNPATVIDAIKALKIRSEQAEADLESAKRKIRKLEKKPVIQTPQQPDETLLARLVDALSVRSHPVMQEPEESLMSRLVDALEVRNSTRSAPVPDTHVFSGDKKDFYNWKESIMMKIKGNSDHYPTEQSRMIYAYSRLNSDSKTHLQTWIQDGTFLFPSFTHMMDQLTVIFGDPNRVRDAASRLHSNPQKNKHFSTWIAEIRRDAAIAGYESNSRYLKDLVLNNMSLELKRALVHEREIDFLGFNETVSRLQDVENRLRSYANAESRYRFRFTGPAQPPIVSRISTQPPSPSVVDDPMDLSATVAQKRGPISQDERERRRRLGLCYYCGEQGHRSFECPKRPQQAVQA